MLSAFLTGICYRHSLYSCFALQQTLGQNKQKSSPNLIKPGSTLVKKQSERRSHDRLTNITQRSNAPLLISKCNQLTSFFSVKANNASWTREPWCDLKFETLKAASELPAWAECSAPTDPQQPPHRTADRTVFQSLPIWTPLLKEKKKIGWLDISVSLESLRSRKTGGRVNSSTTQQRITSFLWNA